jgi:hypothetical protein
MDLVEETESSSALRPKTSRIAPVSLMASQVPVHHIETL